jgi:DNA-directed RNA polymerase omega subunit
MRNSLNEELLKIVPNRFLLAIAAAKRSRQLEPQAFLLV